MDVNQFVSLLFSKTAASGKAKKLAPRGRKWMKKANTDGEALLPNQASVRAGGSHPALEFILPALLGASAGKSVGGIVGAGAGFSRGNTPEGLGRGIIRGGMAGGGLGLGAAAGARVGQGFGDTGRGVGAILGGLLGGAGGWGLSGKLIGKPESQRKPKEDEKEAAWNGNRSMKIISSEGNPTPANDAALSGRGKKRVSLKPNTTPPPVKTASNPVESFIERLFAKAAVPVT